MIFKIKMGDFFETLMILVIILGISIPVSHAIQIIRNKSSENVPYWGYVVNVVINIFWLIHGFSKSDGLICFSSILGIVSSAIVILLIRKYRFP